MSSTLHRINATPGLEVRAGGDGRTIHGLVVPFDTPTRIASRLEGTFTETFRRGAFDKTIREAGGKVQGPCPLVGL